VTKKKATPPASKKAASEKIADKPAAAAPSAGKGAKPVITQQQRQQMIGDAAYLISLKRAPWQGSPDSDWICAETVVDMIFDVAD
jgi:hypothetical protein